MEISQHIFTFIFRSSGYPPSGGGPRRRMGGFGGGAGSSLFMAITR
jgi:hypothetical protein